MPRKVQDINIIYHHPRPIIESGVSGSQVRPYRMLKAFKEIGVNIHEVTGNIKERSVAIKQLKREILQGTTIDFVYSENLTIPFAMSEAHRLPLHPLLDHQFLAFCNANGIPVSLFNRDVYWRDASYKTMLPWWGRLVTLPLYWYDWWQHTQYVDTLYLPSQAMAEPLPWIDSFPSVKFLPPGAEIIDAPQDHSHNSEQLSILYVGGIVPPYYDLRPLLDAVKIAQHAKLVICCREKEWQQQKDFYAPYLSDKVEIVHASGKDLTPLYQNSDIFAVVRNPGSYLDYSVPIKIYEAIGFGKPVLCTPSGETSRIVESESIGWVKEPSQIPAFLNHLAENREILNSKCRFVKQQQAKHTWQNRALQVCEDMA